jgi:hypothetical protein
VSKREFDTSVAHPARVYDYWLGGKDNFAVDRRAAREVLAVMPAIAQVARANRLFLSTAVRHLATDLGIRQFLDIGTGLPTADNTHEVAQRAAPEAKIVYVDNDPIVLSHAHALLKSDSRGKCAYIDADARDTATVLEQAGRTLRFDEPVAVIMLGLLHFIPDSDDPWALTKRVMAPTVPGSYLAVSQAASDIADERVVAAARAYNERSATSVTPRSRAEFTRFFDGLELVPPGVAPLGEWSPGKSADDLGPGRLPTYSALARKPVRAPVYHRYP